MGNSPVHGSPVGMDIHQIHEYRYLQSFIVEVFVFDNLFGNDHYTVGRSNDHVFLFSRKVPAGRAKKVKHQKENNGRCDENHKIQYAYRAKIIE